MAEMTREEMEEVIAAGGSVLVRDTKGNNRLISSVEHLPSEADLARKSGDAKKRAAARKALLDSIAAAQEQIDDLDDVPDEEPAQEEAPKPAPKVEPARPTPAPAPVAPVAPKAPEKK